MSILFDRVSHLKETHHISFYAMEKGADLSQGSIKNWDSSFPSGDKILKLANFLGVSVDYLLGNTDNPLSHKSPDTLTNTITRLVDEINQYNRNSQQFQNNIMRILKDNNIQIPCCAKQDMAENLRLSERDIDDEMK